MLVGIEGNYASCCLFVVVVVVVRYNMVAVSGDGKAGK